MGFTRGPRCRSRMDAMNLENYLKSGTSTPALPGGRFLVFETDVVVSIRPRQWPDWWHDSWLRGVLLLCFSKPWSHLVANDRRLRDFSKFQLVIGCRSRLATPTPSDVLRIWAPQMPERDQSSVRELSGDELAWLSGGAVFWVPLWNQGSACNTMECRRWSKFSSSLFFRGSLYTGTCQQGWSDHVLGPPPKKNQSNNTHVCGVRTTHAPVTNVVPRKPGRKL